MEGCRFLGYGENWMTQEFLDAGFLVMEGGGIRRELRVGFLERTVVFLVTVIYSGGEDERLCYLYSRRRRTNVLCLVDKENREKEKENTSLNLIHYGQSAFLNSNKFFFIIKFVNIFLQQYKVFIVLFNLCQYL